MLPFIPLLFVATAVCGGPTHPGALVEPPNIDASTLPLDDAGRHELILRVARDEKRFCFRYSFEGAERNVAPVLRVRRGERFALRLVNEITGPATGATMAASALPPCRPVPMPDLPVQRFTGYLNHTIESRFMEMKPLDVNVHLHGFEGPAEEENVFLSTLSTPAHACEYDVTVPRTQPPGTYFYHPHAHGMSMVEVAGGLIGMWIVEPDTPQIARANEHEVVLTPRFPGLSDDPIGAKQTAAQEAANAPLDAAHERGLKLVDPITDFDPFDPPPWPSSFLHSESSQSSNCGVARGIPLLAANGINTPATLVVPAGETQLLRILNGTGMQMLDLRLRDASGAVQPMRVVGMDGIPVGGDAAHPMARYVPMQAVLAVPGGRADVLVALRAGETLTLYGDRLCTGAGAKVLGNHDLLSISAGVATSQHIPRAISSRPVRAGESPAQSLLDYARAHPSLVRRRALTYTAYFLPDANGKGLHAEGYLTETSNRDFHEHPYWPSFAIDTDTPEHPDIVVKRGTIEEWYLFNTALSPHTFHIHQMAFASEDAVPMPLMLDNAFVPAGTALPNPRDPAYPLIRPGRTRIILDFRNVPPGEFVYHCHMLVHEDAGMMGVIRVE